MSATRSPDQQLMVDLDETALLAHGDTVARALLAWTDERIEELQEVHDLFDEPEAPSAHCRWLAELDTSQTQALAQIELLRQVRARTYLAWAEDRWSDLGRLGSHHRRHLPDAAVAAARRLCDVAHAFPAKGRAPDPRQSMAMPPVREGVQVPWGVDPDAPVTGRSPHLTSRRLWALLREAFPDASSAQCTVTAHVLLREVIRPSLGPRDAVALRKELAAALGGAAAPPADEHERQRNRWIIESVLSGVVVPVVDERNRLASAVDDVRSLHPCVDGVCRTCVMPWPCPTMRAIGVRPEDAAA